jgi:hypothetical protein
MGLRTDDTRSKGEFALLIKVAILSSLKLRWLTVISEISYPRQISPKTIQEFRILITTLIMSDIVI